MPADLIVTLVFLIPGFISPGTIESAGTIEGDGDLLLKVMYDARHDETDPREELDVVSYADGEEPLIFIPASTIVSFETTESEGPPAPPEI
ncbi:MAG: hypothetical protein AMXMBFR33_35760 [Candidatus Xenobia bacterium]